MEPRTGKTKTSIDLIGCWNKLGEVDRVLIICPNRVMGTWVREIHTHCPMMFNITVWDKDARKAPLPKVTGTYDIEFVIVNFEAFATPGPKTKSGRRSKTAGRFKNRTLLRAWMKGGKTACVVDESHKIKSPSGRAANMITSMGKEFNKRLILTGTPRTKAKRAQDIYMQWKFLNPDRFDDIGNAAEFKAHYGRWIMQEKKSGGKAFPKYVGPRNVSELNRRIGKDSVIVLREDCFDLPPREDIVIPVELIASRKVYNQMAKEMIAILENGTVAEASIALVKDLRLSQITSGFVKDENGEIQRLGFEMHDALKDIIEDLFEKDQKVVIAARWTADLDLIEDLCKLVGFKTYSIRGSVTRAESDANILSFKNATEPAAMIIQPAAAALGIDLSEASTMVWYSHTNSYVDFTQACDRIALSRHSTTFYHLVAKNSVDEILMQTLAEDKNAADEIMKHPDRLLTGVSLDVSKDGKIEMKKASKRR